MSTCLPDFIWSEEKITINFESYLISRLAYKQDSREFYFKFTRNKTDTKWAADYYPSHGNIKKKLVTGEWEQEMGHVIEWAEIIKEEILTPDLWSQFAQLSHPFYSIAPIEFDNKPFPIREIKKIENKIDHIEGIIKDQYIEDKKQAQIVIDYFNILKKALASQDKKTFIYFSIGIFCTLAGALKLSGDKLAQFIEIIKTLFS